MESMQEHSTLRDRANREELVTLIRNATRVDGVIEPLHGLHLARRSQPTQQVHGVYTPSFCVIAHGSKRVYLGEQCYSYDPAHYLLTTVEVPVRSCVVDASGERPYLSLRLDLDPALVGSVMVDAGLPAPSSQTGAKALVVSALNADLLDATLRLVRLMHAPAEARVLVPLVTREIIFRLLLGEQGHRLRHLPVLGGHAYRIAQAVERLRREFDRPLRIEAIAQDLGMSSSGFHDQFKTVTDLSPLQFQKQLRLREARRLMLGEHLDVASAGFRVGYNDASHFSRDYKKHFGVPPGRDVGRLRKTIGGITQDAGT